MLDISEHCKQNIYIGNIFERNERIFPKPNKHAKFEVWTGDHCRLRQTERFVTDKEIIDAFYGAYSQIRKLFDENKIYVSKHYGKDTHFIIVDGRVDRSSPINIAAFLYRNNGNKLQYPSFTVKTVYKGADFSGNIYKHENVEKIFLY